MKWGPPVLKMFSIGQYILDILIMSCDRFPLCYFILDTGGSCCLLKDSPAFFSEKCTHQNCPLILFDEFVEVGKIGICL